MGQMLKMAEIIKSLSSTNNQSQEQNKSQNSPENKNRDNKNVSEKRLLKEETREDRVKYFDDAIHTNSMKKLKSVVPYMDREYQKKLAIMIKVIELQKVIEMYNTQEVGVASIDKSSERGDWRKGMLSAIRVHSTQEEQRMIDMILNLIEMKEFMDIMKGES